MGLENRRSGNVSEGSNPSLSAIFPTDATVSDARISRCSVSVPADGDGTEVGTLTEEDWHWTVSTGCVGYFQLDLFERFLAKCGYTQGRKGRPPVMPADMEAIEPPLADREWVYFARGRNTGLIKIGRSKQPAFRVGQLKHDRFFGDDADAILRAAGSGLRHYTFDSTRAAILAAVLECFQAGYCEGVDSVLQPVGEA